MDNEQQILENIGLSTNEVKVYLALLELGSASTGPIATKADIPASKIYEVLEKLMKKGLAAHIIKNNVKHFEAANPKQLEEYVAKKKAELETQQQQIHDLLPQLDLLKKKEETTTIVYEGFKGIKTVFNSIVEESQKGEDVLVLGAGLIGSHGETSKTVKSFFDQYHKQRREKGIKARLLFNIGAKDKYEYRAKETLTQVKYLPENIVMPAQLNIYKDKVITFIWHKNPTAIIIQDKAIADSYRNYFELLWKEGK